VRGERVDGGDLETARDAGVDGRRRLAFGVRESGDARRGAARSGCSRERGTFGARAPSARCTRVYNPTGERMCDEETT